MKMLSWKVQTESYDSVYTAINKKINFNRLAVAMHKYDFKIESVTLFRKTPLEWSICCVNAQNKNDGVCFIASTKEADQLKAGIRKLKIKAMKPLYK